MTIMIKLLISIITALFGVSSPYAAEYTNHDQIDRAATSTPPFVKNECDEDLVSPPMGVIVTSGWCRDRNSQVSATSTPVMLGENTEAALTLQNKGREDLEIYSFGGFGYKKGKQKLDELYKALNGVNLRLRSNDSTDVIVSYDDLITRGDDDSNTIDFPINEFVEINIVGDELTCDGTYFIEIHMRSAKHCKTADGPLRIQLLGEDYVENYQ